MSELRLRRSGRAAQDNAPQTINSASLEWQSQRESLWAEASHDPEVYAVRKSCVYNCDWWTMAVSDRKSPDIANMEITVDFSRHLFHDCPNVPPNIKARINPCPKPSH